MKRYLLLSALGLGMLGAQARPARDTLPYNWHLQDADGPYFGISLDKAYALLQGRQPQVVIAGVIDSGTDTLHADLQRVLWHNPKGRKEKHYPGSYYGWSYLGSAAGNVDREQLELVRLVRDRKAKGDTTCDFKALWQAYNKLREEAEQTVANMNGYLFVLDAMAAKIPVAAHNLAGFKQYTPVNVPEQQVYAQLVQALSEKDDYTAFRSGVTGYRDHFREELDYNLNFAYDPRSVVGDKVSQLNEKYYGTADVQAAGPHHGTHVAGIIGADRNNQLGMQGIADAVQLLSVRAVPNGDERDKDVANAIRYAVDHGAKVINMSFGKAYSPDKKAVDKAVAYAMKKDVLLICAAGNEHKNLDSTANFPNKRYLTGGEAAAWLEVGASGPEKGAALPAGFSNYGRETVDLFAPGVDIWSTIPGSRYGRESGTSMASPVTCGIAALLRSYFPKLTAVQVKDILLRSVITDPSLADKCRTGGVVNAAKAVELAIALETGRS